MHPDADKLVWDAQQAAERVARFTAGRTLAEYETDEYLRSAVERQFEIIGEALNRLSRVDPATAATIAPDGHPKLLHLWPVKLLQAGRVDYDAKRNL